MRANAKSFKEAMEMGDTAITFDQLMEEVGLAAKWRDRGEEKKAREIAKNLLGNGISLEQTAQLCGLDIADVRKLAEDSQELAKTLKPW
jgi:predicted transposase YdaD